MISVLTYGQGTGDRINNMKMHLYTTEDGLPDNSIRAIHMDSRGYLWLGFVKNGLCRYDGDIFEQIVCSNDNADISSNSSIISIFEDSYARLWITGYMMNASCYDLSSDCFVDYSSAVSGNISGLDRVLPIGESVWLWGYEHDGCIRLDTRDDGSIYGKEFSSSSRELPAGAIRYITSGIENNVWIGTDNGLAVINDNRAEVVDSGHSFISSVPHYDGSFHITGDGDVYSYFYGVFELSAKLPSRAGKVTGTIDLGNKLLIFTQYGTYAYSFERETVEPFSNSLPNAATTEVSKNISIAFNDEGTLLYCNKSNGKIQCINKLFGEGKPSANRIRFSVSDDGILWAVTNGKGLFYYDPSDDSYGKIDLATRFPDSQSDFLLSVLDDGKGHLWAAGSYSGLFKMSKMNEGVSYLEEDMVRMVSRVDDSILVSNADGSLRLFNLRMKEIRHLYDYGNSPYCILHTNSGELFVGTNGSGLFEKKEKVNISWEGEGPDMSKIFSLAEDGKGRIWAAFLESRLGICTREQTDSMIFRNYFSELPFGSSFRVLLKDSSNRIWAGTNMGLYLFYPDKFIGSPDKFECFNIENGSLSSNFIEAIYEDSRHRIWVAETGYGFCQAIVKEDNSVNFKHYSVYDGLINRKVNGITEDSSGCIWLMSDNGASRFNPDTEKFTNYRFSNIRQGNSYSFGSTLFIPESGLIIAGTNSGLCVIDTKKLSESTNTGGRVQFTSMQVNGGQMTKVPEDMITLKHNENSITVRFSALDYDDETKYVSYLSGFEDDWGPVSEDNVAKYTNLPPGRYCLHSASSSDISGSEALLHIRIKPPFYLSVWAFLVYALIASGIALFVISTLKKMNALKTEAEVERRIREFKAEFLRNQVDRKFIEKLNKILERNISNPDFDVRMFANEMAMSRSSFYTKMNDTLGESPNKYLRSFRLNKASELLLNSEYSIEQVANMVGIPDASYFTHLFKTEFGITPKMFKTSGQP